MQKKDHSSINIQWELVDNPDSDQLLRQAVALILRELEKGPSSEGFDKIDLTGHAESVLVENNNQSQPATS
jgi:hypothetical protein